MVYYFKEIFIFNRTVAGAEQEKSTAILLNII